MENLHQPGGFAKNFKCPCCQNPWNQASIENAQTLQTFIACEPCLSDSKGFKGLDPSNFDASVPVGENFYLWSNGGWKTKNPIPNEYSSWNTFIVLRDLNLERLKGILDELLADTTAQSVDEDIEKVKRFYSTFMNEKAIEELGAAPIFDILSLCQRITQSPTEVISKLHGTYGVNVLFSLGSMPDKANSEHTIASLYQSGLGLPDRDYYFDADKREKRAKYLEYIAKLFDLLKECLALSEESPVTSSLYASLKKVDSSTIAERILFFETQLASLHLTRTACRDPNLTYNKMSFEELLQQSSQQTELTWSQYLTYGGQAPHLAFHWSDYFHRLGKTPEALGNTVNLQSKTYLLKLVSVLNEQSSILPFYCMFHVLNSFCPQLSSCFVETHFNFHEKELKGTQELLVRWKRGLQILEGALGEALGKLYVERFFPSSFKEQALQVVSSVREALRERLVEIPWMSPETKQEAFLKMDQFKVKIGYPDRWKDYSDLLLPSTNSHVMNVIAARGFDFLKDLQRMNAPTDKTRWFMTPQTVNAYFHPSLNEIVFPAAILQPPFFDAEADLAVQYGSLGAVVGHEMTHGYDDQGRKYDSRGNLRDWWTKTDGEEYEKRALVMVQQAEQFEVHGLRLNGRLTCGENIADLGGVKLALRALQTHLKRLAQPPPLINGLTPIQRFFLAWSQSWRENVKKERAMQLVTIDPHGPNELRCNGTLSNIADFYEAFGVTEKDKMFIPPEQRVDIW